VEVERILLPLSATENSIFPFLISDDKKYDLIIGTATRYVSNSVEFILSWGIMEFHHGCAETIIRISPKKRFGQNLYEVSVWDLHQDNLKES